MGEGHKAHVACWRFETIVLGGFTLPNPEKRNKKGNKTKKDTGKTQNKQKKGHLTQTKAKRTNKNKGKRNSE